VVDYEDFDGAFGRFQLQSELLLKRGEHARTGIGLALGTREESAFGPGSVGPDSMCKSNFPVSPVLSNTGVFVVDHIIRPSEN
jgi:hypothetical protein